MPAPHEVGGVLLSDWDDLLYHMTATVRSAALGYACAILLAVALGCLATAWPRVERPVLTFGVLLDAAPLIALAPILMLWLGNGSVLHVVLATTAALFPLLVGTLQGLKSADSNLRELFHVIAASRWQTFLRLALPQGLELMHVCGATWAQTFLKVRVPFALPYIFTGLRVAATGALLSAMLAEWLSGAPGLGTLILQSGALRDLPLMWAGALSSMGLAALVYVTTVSIERRLAR